MGAVMSHVPTKIQQRGRRKLRVRKKVFGTAERPRLTVFRSLQNIYAQLINDVEGKTIVEASTRNKDVVGSIKSGGNVEAAKSIGKLLAERATAKGITAAAFDRNGYRYHGRIKALADAAREGGLKF